MNHIIKILILFFLYTAVQGQNNPDIKRTMHWYFGYNAGLDFSSGAPVADTNGISWSEEDCYTMSDTCGELLFYGNADRVYNKEHQELSNGILVGYNGNPTQSIAIPQPENDSIYYIFYDENGGTVFGQFKYAILNINKNNGLGEIISKDNILLDSLATEKVAAVHHCNNKDIWVVSKQKGIWLSPSPIYAWLLTETGLNLTPVMSDVVNMMIENGDGYFRFTSDGKMAAAAYIATDFYPNYVKDSCYVELYKFDNCTGIFSNTISLQLLFPYGICFSPDNTKLYVEAGGEGITDYLVDTAYIFQFDITNYDSTEIINSKTIINSGPIAAHFQIAIDGKIYVADMDTNLGYYCGYDKLGVINNPNMPGLACNYVPESIDLMGKYHISGFPNFVDSYFRSFNYHDCGDTISPVEPNKQADIFIPTAFTPNNDGQNDILYVRGGLKNMKIKIFNQMGLKVFETNEQSKGWNGIYKGKAQPIGNYVYIFKGTTTQGKEITKNGVLSLIR